MKHVTTESQSPGWDADSGAWDSNNPADMRELSPSVHTISIPPSRAPSSHSNATDISLFDSPPDFFTQFSDAPRIRPINFAMWVGSPSQVGGVDGCFHSYTRLTEDNAALPAAPIASIPEWRARFPHAADVLNTESSETCPVLHFQASVSVMSELPTQSSILCTEFEVSSSGGNISNSSNSINGSACDPHHPPYHHHQPSQEWECITRIYAPGKKVWELSHTVDATEVDGSRKLTLPFASDFWAAFYTGLSSSSSLSAAASPHRRQHQSDRAAAADQNEKLRRRRAKECRAAIKGITVVQELFCSASNITTSALSAAGHRERAALFLWDFSKAEAGQPGRTTWREIIPPSPVLRAGVLTNSPNSMKGGTMPPNEVNTDVKLNSGNGGEGGMWGVVQMPLSPFDPLSPISLSSYYTMASQPSSATVTPTTTSSAVASASIYSPVVSAAAATQGPSQALSLAMGDVNFAFDMHTHHQPSSLPPFNAGLLSSSAATALSDPSDYFASWPQGFSPVSDHGQLHVV